MPRIAVASALVLGASCIFSADYKGTYTCPDGVCPSGLACGADHVCHLPGDGGTPDDVQHDGAGSDAHTAALTCADPGTSVVAEMGTTANRTSTISASCNASIMNGPDAVYRVAASVGQTIHIAITASYAAAAYAIAPCTVTPGTPACVGNMYATQGAPITVTAPATSDYFIVVDGQNAGLSGTYTLDVTVN